MKAALSIVLAGLLATLPVKYVLAQAQHEASKADTTLVREPILHVPAVTPETAPLWQPLVENHRPLFPEPSLHDRDVVGGWSDLHDGVKLLIALAAIAAAAVAVFIVLKAPRRYPPPNAMRCSLTAPHAKTLRWCSTPRT